MAASRESLQALCLVLFALPFCTFQSSQVQELADFGGPDLRASIGRSLLQTSGFVGAVLLGEADGGLTLGSVTVTNTSQVTGSTKHMLIGDFSSGATNAFAHTIAQTGCGVMQLNGIGSPSTIRAAFLNLTLNSPPIVFRTRDTNTRVSSGYSNYFVGPALLAGRPAGLATFPYTYSITPFIENDDTVTRTFNVSATFRPVGKACSSATFENDGQQASPVLVGADGEDVLNPTTGGGLRTLLVANATCISIRLDVKNAPTVDQLNATVNLNVTAYAKLGVTGSLLDQNIVSLQQPFTASNITSSYSGSRNDLDPGTVYAIDTSGSGPTRNAVMVSVRVAMLTQKGADCGTQLTADLSLAQRWSASTGQ